MCDFARLPFDRLDALPSRFRRRQGHSGKSQVVGMRRRYGRSECGARLTAAKRAGAVRIRAVHIGHDRGLLRRRSVEAKLLEKRPLPAGIFGQQTGIAIDDPVAVARIGDNGERADDRRDLFRGPP